MPLTYQLRVVFLKLHAIACSVDHPKLNVLARVVFPKNEGFVGPVYFTGAFVKDELIRVAVVVCLRLFLPEKRHPLLLQT